MKSSFVDCLKLCPKMVFFTFFNLFVLILGATGCEASPSSRIVGGLPATSGQFPFIAQIQVDSLHHCAGFIYNAKWIVTTASCVSGYRVTQLKVVVGQVSLTTIDSGEQSFSVLTSLNHPSYDASTKENNIAMLALSSSIKFGVNSNLINHGELPTDTITGTLIGWGNAGFGDISATLQSATVPIVTDLTGCLSIELNMWDPMLMICAGSGTDTACKGDGGDPLVIGTSLSDYVVVGLVSHITSCSYPAAYVRLSAYTNWMLSIGGPSTTTSPAPSTTSSQITTTFTSSVTSSTPTTSSTTCYQASAGDFPFTVSIGDKYGRHFCSGFIYDANYVITTSSCVESLRIDEIFITAGSLRLDNLEPSFSLKRLVLNNEGNIALLEVSQPFTFSLFVGRIRIDQANYAEPESKASGWASTEANGCNTSLDQLWQSVSITLNTENCNWIPNFDGSDMICGESLSANYKATPIFGSCRFESGAPLVQQGTPYVVIGIKSVVEESCGLEQSYTAYTRLSTFLPWIIENTKPERVSSNIK